MLHAYFNIYLINIFLEKSFSIIIILFLRTYRGEGGSKLSVRLRTRGEGGSKNGNFLAYVLNGRPLGWGNEGTVSHLMEPSESRTDSHGVT